MKKYTIKDPVFNEEIMITETGDPGHADNINAAPKQIFENTLVNKKEIEEGDSKNRTVAFDSGDGDAAAKWTDVPVMKSGENHKSLFEKISTMVKNVRFLYKVLGSTDLSAMEDGTVTGILSAIKPYCFVDPVANLLANIKGKPLDATQGAVVQGEIDDLREAVTQINSDLSKNFIEMGESENNILFSSNPLSAYKQNNKIYIYSAKTTSLFYMDENTEYEIGVLKLTPRYTQVYIPCVVASDTEYKTCVIKINKSGIITLRTPSEISGKRYNFLLVNNILITI